VYGLIVKLTVAPGRREEMIQVLRECAGGMPGCMSYVVAEDSGDADTLWVTEVWDSVKSHDASVMLPSVKRAIPRGKELVVGFEKVAVTAPVWGTGLERADDR
jgi:quinol monooxygenase YgiN